MYGSFHRTLDRSLLLRRASPTGRSQAPKGTLIPLSYKSLLPPRNSLQLPPILTWENDANGRETRRRAFVDYAARADQRHAQIAKLTIPRGMADDARLENHQRISGPVLASLREWIPEQFRRVAPGCRKCLSPRHAAISRSAASRSSYCG